MKRLSLVIVTLLFLAIAVDATAQQVVKKRIGVYKENGNVVVAEAVTTLAVDITIEKEEFAAGPYAKYAQKLLGKRASFVDKVQYSIVATDVAVLGDDAYFATTLESDSNESAPLDNLFPQVDRLSTIEKSADKAANDAAAQIFDLRRARLELITGEMGEGVYGGGLESALREIDRLEQEYLELFYGKRNIVRYTHRVLIPVEKGATSYVVARFSADEGLVAKDNLMGDIIMLAISTKKCSYPAGDPKGVVAYRYANNAEVTVALGQEILVSRILPIYEFGQTVMYLNPR